MSAIADLLAVVNSDPGKTLDELILEHIGIGATDVPLQVLVTDRITVKKSEYEKVAGFTSNANGTARLKFEYDASSSNETFYVKVVDEKENEYEVYHTVDTDTWITFDFDFNVEKGLKYELYLKNTRSSGSAGTSYARNIKICGSTSDPTLIIKE